MSTSNQPETDKLRVAVVGMGIGRSHLRAYHSLPEQFEIVALCDIDLPKAEAVAAQLDDTTIDITGDLAELCRRDDIEVIDICTPPHLHVPQVLQVLAAGKHAVCEKPLASSLADVDRVIEAEARSGRRVMPIFQYRFGHGIQKLRHLMAQGLTGQAYLATVETAWRRRPAYYAVPWRGKWQTELGGAIVGHAIHAHDLLCYTLGPVKSVFARVKTLVNDIEVEDTAAISLEMADGSLATLAVTLGSSDEISRHRFCFSNLTAESNTRSYTSSGDPWKFTPDTPELAPQIEAALESFVPQPEGFPGQFFRFHRAIRKGTELPVMVNDARRAIELITAIYHSAQTGHVVELPLGPDQPKYNGWLPS
jgi:predicted dehydrogenase